MWVAIDAADRDNGAMGFLPGSHTARTLFPHETDNSVTLALNQKLDFHSAAAESACPPLAEKSAELNVLAAGELSLHDVYLVHNSRPNLSDQRRGGFVMRYMPSSS